MDDSPGVSAAALAPGAKRGGRKQWTVPGLALESEIRPRCIVAGGYADGINNFNHCLSLIGTREGRGAPGKGISTSQEQGAKPSL